MMELDTKGLRCPLPVLKAKKAIKSLEPGDLICILSNDPAPAASNENTEKLQIAATNSRRRPMPVGHSPTASQRHKKFARWPLPRRTTALPVRLR